MILIISFISSFEINKVNYLPSLTAPFVFTFLSNLIFAFDVKVFNNLGKLFLAKQITIFFS